MTADRIKEIQQETAYPDSHSVYVALLKVWNECISDREQYAEAKIKEELVEFSKHLLSEVWKVSTGINKTIPEIVEEYLNTKKEK